MSIHTGESSDAALEAQVTPREGAETNNETVVATPVLDSLVPPDSASETTRAVRAALLRSAQAAQEAYIVATLNNTPADPESPFVRQFHNNVQLYLGQVNLAASGMVWDNDGEVVDRVVLERELLDASKTAAETTVQDAIEQKIQASYDEIERLRAQSRQLGGVNESTTAPAEVPAAAEVHEPPMVPAIDEPPTITGEVGHITSKIRRIGLRAVTAVARTGKVIILPIKDKIAS